ncbi:MAG TPA: hypothetical protein VGS11_00200 [Candidatus Bathyarchaeia archaeon]|nr:hypothetical protein [Candidatus Bathyarchaeia archaeon]
MKIVRSLYDENWRLSVALDHRAFVLESGVRGILDADFNSELKYHKAQCSGCRNKKPNMNLFLGP